MLPPEKEKKSVGTVKTRGYATTCKGGRNLHANIGAHHTRTLTQQFPKCMNIWEMGVYSSTQSTPMTTQMVLQLFPQNWKKQLCIERRPRIDVLSAFDSEENWMVTNSETLQSALLSQCGKHLPRKRKNRNVAGHHSVEIQKRSQSEHPN